MKAMRSWGCALGWASLALLAACGGGGKDEGSVQMRLLNASIGHATLDMSVDNKLVNQGVAYASVGSYAGVKSSATATQVQAGDVGGAVASTTPSLAEDSSYTLIAYGTAGAVKTSLLRENQEPPASDKVKLLVLNLAPDAGALDAYVTTSAAPLAGATPLASNVAGGASSGYITLNSGSFRVRLTGAGSKTDLRLDLPAVSLPSAGVVTLVVTGSDGGVLVNGMLLVQKGGLTHFPNSTARVRLLAATGGATQVMGTLGSTTLLPASLSPTVGDYKTVDAGSPALQVQVNGQALAASAPELKAGRDYTLMVWGPAATPRLAVLADDNRLPTSTGTARIRLVNATAAASTGLTLNVDYSAVATNVLAGQSSDPVTLSSTTASLLTVSSPTATGPVYTLKDLALQSGGVYTVFMMGDDPAITGSLRKER